MKKYIASALIAVFICLAAPPARGAGIEYKLSWPPSRYSDNFVKSFFPSDREISKMNVWAFFYLWGLVSFIESNIPEGLDGKRYAILVRDLKKDIGFLKNDMMFLVKEVWDVRRLDRDIIKVQLFEIYSKLQSIITAVQKVRTNLIKPAYFLFYNSLDHTIFIDGGFDFSITLNYMSVDSVWSSWRSKEEVAMELDWAEKIGVNTVKVTVLLDYWVYKNTSRVNEIKEMLGSIKKRGMKLYITFLGVREWYGEDYTFQPRTGRIFGKVNFLTWRYHCEQAMTEIIGEFKPDYACVIREPLVDMQEQLAHATKIDDWLDCFSLMARQISKISPATVVVLENGVSTPADYELFEKIQKLKNKNIAFGALIYSLKDIFSYNQYAKMCKVRKKTIIAEFWDSVVIYIDEYAEDFIYLVYRWALNHKMPLINLSYSLNTHTYDYSPTPAFYVYKNIITRTFMEGVCKKGVKSNPDGIWGTLYAEYDEAVNINYQFRNGGTLKDYKD
ncbi:MAG: hypothetical protein BWY32_02188 [bacterium ADurb.Bin243]|nr:MAG: hypothetical protein BWY32_02188 [bacterium ADurb.Bin243]